MYIRIFLDPVEHKFISEYIKEHNYNKTKFISKVINEFLSNVSKGKYFDDLLDRISTKAKLNATYKTDKKPYKSFHFPASHYTEGRINKFFKEFDLPYFEHIYCLTTSAILDKIEELNYDRKLKLSTESKGNISTVDKVASVFNKVVSSKAYNHIWTVLKPPRL
jgi:hypothetical protein